MYTTEHLHIWHLYLAQALKGTFEAFELPAYSAATTLLVSKAQYARTNGMRALAESASQVFGPILAGVMLTLVNINGVMLVDVVSFLVAIATLLMVRIPRPVWMPDELTQRPHLWQEVSFGFHYIFQKPGLLGLLMIFVGINLFAAMTYFALLPAMILARSGDQQMALATVGSALGSGGVVGGLLVSIWGGPKQRIHAIFIGAALSFLLGDFLLAIGRSVKIWVIAAFIGAFFVPFITSANRALWQSKVAPNLQGRVFSVQAMLQQATTPIGYLLAGPLADRLFEPAMARGGRLAVVFGWLVGIGPGAGMALMFACTSLLGMAMSLSGYMFRAVRCVESDVPDHDEFFTVPPRETGAK